MRNLWIFGVALVLLPAPLAAESAYEQLLKAAPGSSEVVQVPSVVGVPVGQPRRIIGIGLAHSGNPFDIPDFSLAEVAVMLREAGGTHYRPHLPLNEAAPELSSSTLARLRLAAEDPAVLEAMTDELSRNGRWQRMDQLVDTFTQEKIKLILVVGAGYRKEAPLYTRPDGSKDHVSPDRIGRDVYIAMARWLAGAGVRRYGDRVEFWQVENEINSARVVAPVGWRVNEPSWGDKPFLKKLIAGLCATVHAEGARMGRPLKTAHNFATDFASWQDWVKPAPEFKIADDIEAFGSDGLDIVGIDMYANYFNGFPMRKDRVAEIIRQTVAASGGRPVWIMETGFPRAPALRGFTAGRQAEYFRYTFDTAYREGVSLVLAFGWFWNPKGWFTDDPNPPGWTSPQVCERYWSPLTVTKQRDGTKDVRYGPAWQMFEDASRRWVSP